LGVVVVVTAVVVVVVVVVVVLEEEDGADDGGVDDTVCDGTSDSVGSTEGVLMSETRAGSSLPEPAGSPDASDPTCGASTYNAATTAPSSAPVASRPGPLIAANTRIAYLVHSIGSS
jgi:hypothetical protein